VSTSQLDGSARLRLSPRCVLVEDSDGGGLAYHALHGRPRLLDGAAVAALKHLESEPTVNEMVTTFGPVAGSFVSSLVDAGLVEAVGVGSEEVTGTDGDHAVAEQRIALITKAAVGANLSRLELAISDACNLACPHCMHFGNNAESLARQSKMRMDFESAKRSVDAFVVLVRRHGTTTIRLHFGNGEPLTNFGVLKKVLEYCDELAGIDFSYAMNTNLTLLTYEMAVVLKHYGVKIATSVDGTQQANDLIRIDRRGRGTYRRIIEKFDLLRQVGHPIEGFTITVTDRNFAYIDTDVLDLAAEYGVTDVSMDFDLVFSNRFTPQDCVAKLIRMRTHARSLGISFYGTWETPFRNLLNSVQSGIVGAFCPAMQGETLEFGVDGDIRTCGHTSTVVGERFDPETALGSDGRLASLIGNRAPGANEPCRGCIIEGPCAGQCQVTREASVRDSKVFDFNCELLRGATEALVQDYIRAARL